MSDYHGNSPNSWPSPLPNSPFLSFQPVNVPNLNPFGSMSMHSPFMGTFNSQFHQTLPNGWPFAFTTPLSPNTAPLSPNTAPVSPTTNTNVMPRPTDSPTLTSLPPCPPNWQEHYQNTMASLRTYQLFPVDPNTFEYAAIVSLLDPALITTVEQVVNPTLWSRFVNTRKDMLKSKCNDLELLSKLELSETELLSSYQHSLNFETEKKVLAVPYNDNMALLFHCTRDPSYIDSILRQGLDERIGNTQGLLGKGIYFADNPEKSMSYDGCGGLIFVFAVLLGDCLALDGRTQFVREPEKLREQKRNFNDFFFDSIVGQPGTGLDNEYVIYNRYQCCPLYMIRYSPGSYSARANPNSDAYVTSRKYFPPVGWTSSANYYVTPARVQKTWPFYAKTIFAKMGALVEATDEHVNRKADENGTMGSSVEAAEVVDKNKAVEEKTKKKVAAKKPSGLSLKLQRLSEMGFHDRDENIEILRKHNFKLDKCVSYLLNRK